MPDFHEDNEAFRRRIEREMSEYAQRMNELFAKRIAQIGPTQNPRLAITVTDADATPTYPTQGVAGGNTFPIIFLSGGFTHSAGLKTPHYTQHRATRQGFVHCFSNNWIPPGTYLQVWQDRGVDATYPGEWWTSWMDTIRYGKVTTTIAYNGQNTVREWLPNDYGTESDSGIDWKVRNLMVPDGILATTRIFFEQIGSVAYAISGACDAESS